MAKAKQDQSTDSTVYVFQEKVWGGRVWRAVYAEDNRSYARDLLDVKREEEESSWKDRKSKWRLVKCMVLEVLDD